MGINPRHSPSASRRSHLGTDAAVRERRRWRRSALKGEVEEIDRVADASPHLTVAVCVAGSNTRWLGLCVGLYCADRFAPRYPDSHLEDTLTGLTLFVGPGISISLHWWLGGFIGAKLDRMREAEEKP